MKKILYFCFVITMLAWAFLLISCNNKGITTKPIVTYSITYELNGGTNSENNPDEYKTGDTVCLDFPTKEDYMFAGWYTDSSFTTFIREINDREEDITLYAKWLKYENVLTFVESNEGYYVNRFNDNAAVVILPSTYNGKPVIGINNFAFSFCDSLIHVVISDSIMQIGNHSFYQCRSLESIVLPQEIKSIERLAFGNCPKLKSILVDENNKYYKSIDGVLYSKDGRTIIKNPNGKEGTSFVIPKETTTIYADCFSMCKNLLYITIPDSVTCIQRNAFYQCTSLESVTIPNSVVYTEDDIFACCTSLKSATLSNSMKTINSGFFNECDALESIIIPEGVKTIERKAFSSCDSLKSVTIPDSVTAIKSFAFSSCPALEKIIIPESVAEMEGQVFEGCISLLIYCEAIKKPHEWNNDWAWNVKEVIWGYKGE